MSENGSKRKGVIAGRVLLAVCVVICAAAFMMSAYLEGQKKTVTGYYTAVMRGDFSAFEEFFQSGVMTEGCTERLTADYENLIDGVGFDENSLMHLRINFKGREMRTLTESDYYFTVTYFDGDAHDITTERKCFSLKREGARWRLMSEKPAAA